MKEKTTKRILPRNEEIVLLHCKQQDIISTGYYSEQFQLFYVHRLEKPVKIEDIISWKKISF